MKPKIIPAVSLTFFLALVLLVTPVLAGYPHFSKAKASGPDNIGYLTVNFTFVGEPNNYLSVEFTTTREAIYACKPADGDFPSNPIQEIVTDYFYYWESYTSKNGSNKGESIIPPPETSLICDGDMITTLAMVTYSDIVLWAYVGGISQLYKSIPGTFSATYYGYTP